MKVVINRMRQPSFLRKKIAKRKNYRNSEDGAEAVRKIEEI